MPAALERPRYVVRTALRSLDFFREQDDADFGLLVCQLSLVPFYERQGWRTPPATCS